MMKTHFIPRGVIPALVTPLDSQERFNDKALRNLIRYTLKGGVHGIFVIGTTGEFYAMDISEKRRVIETAIDECKGRVPVYAGTGGITTRECIALTQMAEDCGADAVSVLTPMFISPSQNDLYTHFKSIADNTSLPVILYNNKPRTGVGISAETAARLATSCANIVGIKDSSGDFTLTGEYIRLNRENEHFHVLQGRDTQIYAGLSYGATGAIAACANVAPRIAATIYDKFIAGDLQGALEAQYELAPLRLAFSLGTFPAVIKDALKIIGIDVGDCAQPVNPLNAEEKKQLTAILQAMKLL